MNNNLLESSSGKCKCGRRPKIAEWQAGIVGFVYECPDCIDRKFSTPLTSAEFYEQIDRVFRARKDLRPLTNKAAIAEIWESHFEAFIVGNDYEQFAQNIQNLFILTPDQWAYILWEWEQKERILGE